MGKNELPPETSRQPLDYGQVVSTLELIAGESVVVRLASPEPSADGPGIASMIGELRPHVPARYEGHEFSIGSPYPDRGPDHLAGGVLFLSERTFTSATLTTFDGNDYFIISIKAHGMHIHVQDTNSTYP